MHVGVRVQSVMFFTLFLFICLSHLARRRIPYVADRLQQDIASAFVG